MLNTFKSTINELQVMGLITKGDINIIIEDTVCNVPNILGYCEYNAYSVFGVTVSHFEFLNLRFRSDIREVCKIKDSDIYLLCHELTHREQVLHNNKDLIEHESMSITNDPILRCELGAELGAKALVTALGLWSDDLEMFFTSRIIETAALYKSNFAKPYERKMAGCAYLLSKCYADTYLANSLNMNKYLAKVILLLSKLQRTTSPSKLKNEILDYHNLV